jgi:fatty acid desaturase
VTGFGAGAMLAQRMDEATISLGTRAAPIPALELRALQRRSNAKGSLQLVGHLGSIGVACALYVLAREHASDWPIVVIALLAYGFTLVTMFAAMHETVHRTAFEDRRLNDAAAWLAGLLSFYNATFYRHYHGWHHRFTQIPGKDPELEDLKPSSLGNYALELSGIPWWIGKLRTHVTLALGRTRAYPYLNDKTGPAVVRSVRLQLATYAAAIALSIALGSPYFVTYWLLPVAVAQPLLRAVLMAEHSGCSLDDDAMNNTRTTYTFAPVRFLMWQMPFHAEHHRYPSLPFFALSRAHARIGPHLGHVASRGYSGMHSALLRDLLGKRHAG